jgi:chitinase
MALKFLYITTDPFVNQSEEFVRILAVENYPTFPSGGGAVGVGYLYDSNNVGVAYMELFSSTQATEATAYPYAFSAGWSASQIIIVPPGWSFRLFTRAIAVQGTLEEVLRVH